MLNNLMASLLIKEREGVRFEKPKSYRTMCPLARPERQVSFEKRKEL